MRIAFLATVVALTGCAGSAMLVRDGKAYSAEISKATRTMTATIDGEVYKGDLVLNQTFGFGTGFSAGRVGFGSMVGVGNQARATLISPSNKILRCDLTLQSFSAQGVCQDPQGNVYDVVAK
ncbi:MAG: hypothetical protein KIT86_00575 [Hydrogenophaga sp.]|jgi:hypothetical protein|uniref:hypothetical protein n=1 Tax=Hydrogenophaga sp. TaxID=1904254 RepID=UPI0026200131|nr:hypothetical protein [Hydrogenophaga sp.]MCW5668120.1 hypothetical protein [Hydrogenophaga sp.]